MTRTPTIALIATGNLSRSWMRQLPRLLEHLGPVFSSNPRTASRIVNILQAGTAASDAGALAEPSLVLVRVGEGELARLRASLTTNPVDWQGKVVVLCDTRSDSAEWAELEQRGAMVATLNCIDGVLGFRFVMEGHPEAIRQAQYALGLSRADVLEIQRSRKSLYDAGRRAATLVVPLAVAAEEGLRQAGVEPKQAARLVEQFLMDGLRSYRKSGLRGWSGDYRRVLDFVEQTAHPVEAPRPARKRPARSGQAAAAMSAVAGRH
jgi:hypothetical protein